MIYGMQLEEKMSKISVKYLLSFFKVYRTFAVCRDNKRGEREKIALA